MHEYPPFLPETRGTKETAALLLPACCCCLRDQPVDLKDLGVLTVDIDSVRARKVPDVLRVRVAPVLLRRISGESGLFPLDVALLERDVGLIGEVEVVPGNLVAEDGRSLEGAQPLGRDRLVVLVDVVQRRLE